MAPMFFHRSRLTVKDGPVIRRVEIPLTMDAEFFRLLQERITPIDEIREEQQKELEEEIQELSKELTVLTKPSKYHKSDMYRWRELFDLYLQGKIE